ncbi:MAG: TerD family protein [Roseibium sp.]|uniref:TerD family protein n=1 Tax=Roseibium sp. TaxID=1936156 RepID=UPI003296926B
MLYPGANTALNFHSFKLDLKLPAGTDIDVSALQLDASGKVRGDDDMCFFNQMSIAKGAIVMSTPAPKQVSFSLVLDRVDTDVQKIVFTATIDKPGVTFGNLDDVEVSLSTGEAAIIPSEGRTEAALIICEIYRHNGKWKLRNVGQGFDGGLKDLAEHFGVEVADPAPAPSPSPTPPPAPAPAPAPPAADPAPITPPSSEPLNIAPRNRARSTPPAGSDNRPLNLSKISLTKKEKTISLAKESGRYGKIRVNLNWNQRPQKSGLLGLRSSAIDLDLGAFVEDRHGNVTAIQALGNMFGDYDYFPYIRLLGDDRTGAVSDGEWLEINGTMWSETHRILIYAFIYEGVPNWEETNGVIRIMIPDQPEIEVQMNEFDSRQTMCAVAYLENVNGQIKVSRELNFFNSQQPMDQHYGFGMNWRAGSK